MIISKERRHAGGNYEGILGDDGGVTNDKMRPLFSLARTATTGAPEVTTLALSRCLLRMRALVRPCARACERVLVSVSVCVCVWVSA